MGEAIISRRGGGKLFAVIDVSYPEGAVCTCSNGTSTLKARGTGGHFLFNIPTAGDWTVMAVLGEDTAAETVSITSSGQSRSVELNFALYIFKSGQGLIDGVTVDGLTNNGDLTGQDALIWAQAGQTDTGNEIQFSPEIDFSRFATLNIDILFTGQYSAAQNKAIIAVTDKFRTGESLSTWDTLPKKAQKDVPYKTTRQTVSLDVTRIADSAYITFWGFGTAGEIYNIWLK